MYQTFKRSLIATATLLAIGAVALPAAARTVPASIGAASVVSQTTCFTEYAGSRTNTDCDVPAALAMALPSETFGSKTASVSVSAPDASHNISCAAISANQMHTSYYVSPTVSPSSFGTPQLLTVSANVPVDGIFEVVCWLGKGSAVYGISYNP